MIKKNLLIFLLILSISFIVFLPSFNLALFGDDWLAFWRYLIYLGPNSSGQWNHISYFLTSYGPEDIFMGLLQNIYNFNSFYYYLTSYFLRILAALSIFPLVKHLTKNNFASLIAVAFFAITTIGIETTAWVFNMSSYLAIIFLNFFFYFYLSSIRNPKLFIITIFLLCLTIISQSIRMHGLLPTIMILELFQLKKNIKSYRYILLRISLFIIVFIFILNTLEKSPVVSGTILLNDSIKNFFQYLGSGKFDILLHPLITFGALFIPANLFSNEANLLLILAAILMLFIWIKTLRQVHSNPHLSFLLILSLVWSILSYFFAWWRQPQLIFYTTHRYLIVSAVGISLMVAVLLTVEKNGKRSILNLLLVLLFLILNLFATYLYLQKGLETHSQKITDRIWSTMPYVPEVGKSNEPLVFYFQGDGTNETILRDVITFGFPPHMGLIYNVFDEDKTPIPMSDFNAVISAVTDGKSFAPYSHPQKAIPVDRVYAFQLQGRDNLINITDFVREKLLELKK